MEIFRFSSILTFRLTGSIRMSHPTFCWQGKWSRWRRNLPHPLALITSLGRLRTASWRWAGCGWNPFARPGDFPRALHLRAGVPTCDKIPLIPRRTCWGVSAWTEGRSYGRKAAWPRSRANSNWLWANATNQLHRSYCSGVRTWALFHSNCCLRNQ